MLAVLAQAATEAVGTVARGGALACQAGAAESAVYPVTLQLRPYQIRAVDMLRAAYLAGRRSPVLVMPTGAGKTQVAALVIASARERGNASLFIAGRTELLDQTVDKLAGAGVTDVRVIQADRDTGDSASPVTVASFQTLTQDGWLDRLPRADLVIIDESHHASCSSIGRILQRFPAARLLGLTATPIRGDRATLSPPFDSLITGPTVAELTALGHLVPCRLIVPSPAAELKSGELAMDPVDAYLQHGAGGLATVFCSDVKHAIATAAAFTAAGIPAAHVDGRMSGRRRAAVLADLASGRIRCMPSCEVVCEGFDLPALSVAIIARKVGHVGRWIQMIGRVLRPSPGKTIARVIDLCGSAYEHGPPELPRTYSLDGDGIAPMVRMAFRTCGSCYAMFVAAAACPHCGTAVPMSERAGPRVRGVGLVEYAPREVRAPAAPKEFVVTIASKYRGTCCACGQGYARGDRIHWATLARKARHLVCPAAQVTV